MLVFVLGYRRFQGRRCLLEVDREDNYWVKCEGNRLSKKNEYPGIPNCYIGYQIPITESFTLIPSYETTFSHADHLSSFTIYLDFELFK